MGNWKTSTIEDLCILNYGKSPKGIESEDGVYPIYGTGGVVGNTHKSLFNKPSLILGRKGSIGNIYYVDTPFWTIDTTFYVEAKNCHIKWLYYLFCGLNIERLNEATGVPSLSRNNIYAQEVRFSTNIQEQQKIAEILSTVDKKIDLIDQKIAETQKLKTGLMQKLFSEGVGVQDKAGNWQPHTEFKVNGYPASWAFLKLGTIAKITSGGTPSRKEVRYWSNGTIPWITTGEVNFNRISNSEQKITIQGLNSSSAKLFPKDTLLMAMYGQGRTRGRVAILDIEASTNQACAAIICTDKLVSSFGYHYLTSQYEKLRCIGNEGSQKNLNGQIIKDVFVPCPPIYEQKYISSIFDTLDKKIDLLKQQKSATQALKKGLMQKLLTGEWRVPIDTVENA